MSSLLSNPSEKQARFGRMRVASRLRPRTGLGWSRRSKRLLPQVSHGGSSCSSVVRFASGKRLAQRRSLGQIFLKDQGIASKIVRFAGDLRDQHVVEVGCGLGALTGGLAERSRELTVIESDSGFLNATLERLGRPENVRGVHGDFTKTGFDAVPSGEKFTVVTNLPYQISTQFVQTVIQERRRIDRCVVMVQREFAERLAASPGSKTYGSLSIFAQFYLNVRPLMNVPREAFKPVPNVDSCVVEMAPLAQPMADVDEETFFKLVRSAFWGRRKTLSKCIRQSPHLTDVAMERAPSDCAFFQDREMVRGEQLSIADFVLLHEELFGRAQGEHR